MLRHNFPKGSRRFDARVVIVGAMFCAFASGAYAGTGTYTIFNPPGATKTEGLGINTAGQIVGDFTDGSTGDAVCFVRNSDGEIVPFTVEASPNCVAIQINDDGTSIGRIAENGDPECTRNEKGFVRASSGKAKAFGFTKTASSYAYTTGINAKGNIVGVYRDDTNANCDFRGFIRDKKTGELTDIPVKNAQDVFANGINDHGFITGNVVDFDQGTHGFVIADKKLTPGKKCGKNCQLFDIPDAADNNKGGAPQGITSEKDVTGYFADAEGVFHGFIRSSDGMFTQLDDPHAGTQSSLGTFPLSINDSGAVAGYYLDGTTQHGFVYTIAGGFLPIDCPGSSFTQAHSINALGQITGQCTTVADNITHGFLWEP